jgi:peroxiredoxin
MKKFFLLSLLFPVFSFSQTANKEFKVKGTVSLSKPVDWVYLRYYSGDNSVTDSLQAKNGEFKFEGKIAEPTVATLVVKFVKAAGEEKAGREALSFFLEPSKIEITAKDSLKANSITGSAGNTDFQSLVKLQSSYDPQFESLYKNYSERKAAGDKEALKKVESTIDALDLEMREKVFGAFLKTHPKSPVALYALKQYGGYEIDPDKIEPLFNSLPGDVQLWPSAVAYKSGIDIAKKTAVGKYAMDFTQNDTLGNPVALSSFKGKYVLVDFWASWCGPCRAENPNVVKTYNKYKDKNFTILSVSLDRPTAKDKWIKAIHDDGLVWTHVSDLKFWDNEVAKQYGIRAIPQNLLLDPQGKIVAKNLRGEELDEKLGAFLTK